jgi:hypothetical protein
MQLSRIIYYSLAALHVLSNIFAHHQEHLNCIIASSITHLCCCRLVSWECMSHVKKYTRYARHIHDPVLSSLKMKGIHLLFVAFCIFLLFNGVDVGIGHTCKAARLKQDCNNMRLSG